MGMETREPTTDGTRATPPSTSTRPNGSTAGRPANSATPEAATVTDYVDWRLAKHLLPYFTRHPLSRIDKRLCAHFKSDKVADRDDLDRVIAAGAVLNNRTGNPIRPLSNRSITMFIRLLGQILDQAVEDELIAANPACGKHMRLAVEKPVRTFLEIDELADLRNFLSAPGRI